MSHLHVPKPVGLILAATVAVGFAAFGVVTPASAATTATITAPDTVAPGASIQVTADMVIDTPTDPDQLPSLVTLSSVAETPGSATGTLSVSNGSGTPPLASCAPLDLSYACQWPGAAEGSTASLSATFTASPDASGTFLIAVVGLSVSETQIVIANKLLTIEGPPPTGRGSFQATVETTPDATLRPGAATETLECTDSLFSTTLVVAPGQASATTPVHPVVEQATCVPMHASSGAADDVVTVSIATLTRDGVDVAYNYGDSFILEPGVVTRFTIADTLEAALELPSPGSAPTGTPALAATGLDSGWRAPLLSGAAVALTIGAALVIAGAVRRRRQQ